jgi:hypothetical protein
LTALDDSDDEADEIYVGYKTAAIAAEEFYEIKIRSAAFSTY